MANGQSRKARRWFGMRNFYFETHDADGNVVDQRSHDEWKTDIERELIDEVTAKGRPVPKRTAVAFVFHDRDVDEHGTPKPLHVHFIVEYVDVRDRETVLRALSFKSDSRPENLQEMKSQGASYRYLTHTTDEAMRLGKVRYRVDELVVYALKEGGEGLERLTEDEVEAWYRKKIQAKSTEKAPKPKTEEAWHDVAEAVREGLLRVRQSEVKQWLSRRLSVYGLDDVGVSTFIRNRFRQLEEEAKRVRQDKAREKMALGRRLKALYITGKGGLGKSKLAHDLATVLIEERFGAQDETDYADHVYTASVGGSGTFDPLGNYTDEEVTVMDDMSPLAFPSPESFLKMFEPNLCPQIPSRNKDVYFLSEYVILTKALGFDEWLRELAGKAPKDFSMPQQIRRRIRLVVVLETDCIRVLKLERDSVGGFDHKQVKVFEFDNLEYVGLLELQGEGRLGRPRTSKLKKLEKQRSAIVAELIKMMD